MVALKNGVKKMKGLKVIGVVSNPEDCVTFGTSGLRFSYDVVDDPYMVLEFPDGTRVTHETYEWDWGDYFAYSVDNIADFSAWLSEQDLFDEDVESLKDNKYVLISLIEEYNHISEVE